VVGTGRELSFTAADWNPPHIRSAPTGNLAPVAARDIVILTPLKGKSALKEGDRAGEFTLTWEEPKGANNIQLHTIYRFKGLERPVVLLVEIDQRERSDLEELIYVAASRANALLVILLNGEAPVDLRTRLGLKASAET
jgi:hypothetical protein